MRLHHNDNKALWSLLAIAIVAGFIGSRLEWHHNTGTGNGLGAFVASALEDNAAKLPTPTFTLGFVGDVMLDGSIRQSVVKNFKGDYSQLFTNAEFLHEPDITFANLQGPASNMGTNQAKTNSFRMDASVLPALKAAGVSVVSLANAHAEDWGRPALEDTLARIKQNGMLACGAGATKAEAAQPATIEQNGFRIGYLCFSANRSAQSAATDTQSGVLFANDPNFDTIVASASHSVNALIVSFDWGTVSDTQHTPDQEALAKKAIDDGAAMVV